ncbi:MAG: tRNA (adenosine(37)-N6)-threonylcarbamoyltransferase complex ATPase subunit type 1 TsaE [Rhodospirillales bacterium]
MFSRLLLTESDTAHLGAELAALARPGDVIALAGDLGAGKSVMARGFIRALAGQDIDVPSPTFTLLQTYETPDAVVWHFDLYRLEDPEEIWELGVEDAFDEGISLFEWPGKGGSAIPADRLTVSLTIRADDSREASLSGGPSWADRLKGLSGHG